MKANAIVDRLTGKHRYVYDGTNGNPFHLLGERIEGRGTIDECLELSGTDYTVEMAPLFIPNADGTDFVEATTHRATVAYLPSMDEYGNMTTDAAVLGIVKPSYTIEQNRSAAEFAYDCVEATHDTAIVDSMGVMKNLAQFFVYLRLDPIIVDVMGVPDELEMGLVVINSHDGSVSLSAFPSTLRVVCSNVLTHGMADARRSGSLVSVRHTKNKEDYKASAVAAMRGMTQYREMIAKRAQYLANMPVTFDLVRLMADRLWPLGDDPTPNALTRRDNRMRALRSIWLNERNTGTFPPTYWIAYQTVAEYLDHHRGGNHYNRAISSIEVGSSVSAMKRQMFDAMTEGAYL